MRVLLLNPPSPDGARFVREARCTHPVGVWGTAWPPYSLAVLARALSAAGHEVRLRDAAVGDVRFRDLGRLCREFRPDVAVCSAAEPTWATDRLAFREIRCAAGDCRLGAIGVYVSAEPERCLAAPDGPDFVARGEPDLSVPAAVEALAAGESPAQVPGISARTPTGIAHAPPRPFLADPTRFTVPQWSSASIRRYRLPGVGRPFLPILTSRGCPYRCAFCTQHLYYGRTFRPRCPTAIAAEVRDCLGRHNVRDFLLWSECFSADRAHALAVCGVLSQIPSIAWTATTRVDCVDRELLGAMREAGCWLVAFGIESADESILAGVGKGHSVEQARQAVAWAAESGLTTAGHFVLGLPGETAESMAATVRLARDLGLDLAQFYCAAPYAGTGLGRLWRTGSPTEGPPDQLRALMPAGGLGAAAITRARRLATARFYLRPRMVRTCLRLLRVRFSRPGSGRRAADGVRAAGGCAP